MLKLSDMIPFPPVNYVELDILCFSDKLFKQTLLEAKQITKKNTEVQSYIIIRIQNGST